MNRLWVRLTVAFIIVTQLAIGIVAVLASTQISGVFRSYVIQRNIALLEDSVKTIGQLPPQIAIHGTFQQSVPAPDNAGLEVAKPFSIFLLADAAGKILYDPNGERVNDVITTTERDAAIPLPSPAFPIFGMGAEFGQTNVAFAIPPDNSVNVFVQAPELDFLSQLNRVLILAAVLVGIIGAIIGFLINRMLVAPLASLAQAARAFAAHDWSNRIPLRGPSEITSVAAAFNEMADELTRAETARRNLIADIAHELRTPLSVMQCNLRGLLDGVYRISEVEIGILYDETRLLSRLVSDLHELALADAGKLNLHLASVSLEQMLQGLVHSFTAFAENNLITLEVQPALPLVRADADRVMQVLRNMLTNALRHTPEGSIRVSAQPQQDDLLITVEDTGEGIPVEDLPHVFDRFYRGDKSRARSSGGSGLGLAITKALVEAMHGKIGVESTPGAGSRFWFTLPLAPEGVPRR
jgi:two-component system OmpR family sensor kinase/two-component system sensor histidine kinase BaeS